jgi:drug/metabolite transporter (DMT)-like permease
MATLPRTTPTAGALPSSAPAVGVLGPSSLKIWSALWIVYVVWGSTYLAIRVMVRTIPPLLGAGLRFALAGAVVLAVLKLRGRDVSISRGQVRAAALIGLLLPGANAVVAVAEQEVPSGIAALLVASIPLFVIVMRLCVGERPRATSIAAVALGFGGVAVLMLPGEAHEGASLLALSAVVLAALMWAGGSFASPRIDLPKDPFVSTGWQMLLGGLLILVAAAPAGEFADLDPSAWSGESVLAFAYLVTFGSWLAFTAYVWLLQNAPVSKVATYAYVNPVIAIVLGALILSEPITALTVVGAAIIVVSVALVVRTESRAYAAK